MKSQAQRFEGGAVVLQGAAAAGEAVVERDELAKTDGGVDLLQFGVDAEVHGLSRPGGAP